MPVTKRRPLLDRSQDATAADARNAKPWADRPGGSLEPSAGRAKRGEGRDGVDYDDVVQQSFPASDPPPPKG